MPSTAEEPSPWQDKKVDSWEVLIKELHDLVEESREENTGGHLRSPYFFRGMTDASWELKTSLERLDTVSDEVEWPALRAFEKYAPVGTFSRDSEWECLAVAQHNGLPTRVLDWTSSPLIAAHFATVERPRKKEDVVDGVIWCINHDELRAIFPDELREELLNEKAFAYNVPLLDKRYRSLKDFDSVKGIDSADVLIFLEPPSIDARIHNQYAILSVMNGASKSHHMYLSEHSFLVRRIVIDSEAKSEIRDMLDQNNITERMLFPGLPGLCDWLRRYYGLAYSKLK